jgi:hypothetical protein
MKVEEAKKKVCPFMSHHVSSTMDDILLATANCICGDCMAWEYDWMLDGSGNEPCENEKEGHCKRIGQ